jgi:hypothetical protein
MVTVVVPPELPPELPLPLLQDARNRTAARDNIISFPRMVFILFIFQNPPKKYVNGF